MKRGQRFLRFVLGRTCEGDRLDNSRDEDFGDREDVVMLKQFYYHR